MYRLIIFLSKTYSVLRNGMLLFKMYVKLLLLEFVGVLHFIDMNNLNDT